jgi:hypothetical protein
MNFCRHISQTICQTIPIALLTLAQPVWAESVLTETTPTNLAPTTINISQFRKGVCLDGSVGSTDRDIKPEGVTIPSLWWTRDQLLTKNYFNPKLIEGWLVCDAGVQTADARICTLSGQRPGRVDVLINTQLWSVLDYLNRYELLYRLGTATSECGYNVYLYDTEAKLIGDYTCKFPDRPQDCTLRTDPTGKGGLRRGPSDVFAPITNGIGQP